MKSSISLSLLFAFGVFVSIDCLRAMGPSAPQEEGKGETPIAKAILSNFDKLASEDKGLKEEALDYFRSNEKAFEAEVPLFISLLKDERYQVRATSVEVLGKIGRAASKSFPKWIPEVEKLLADSSATVRIRARRALKSLKDFKSVPKRSAPKKVAAKEAAEVFAFLIGEWEGSLRGFPVAPIGKPFHLYSKYVSRWKEKGKSIETTKTTWEVALNRGVNYVTLSDLDRLPSLPSTLAGALLRGAVTVGPPTTIKFVEEYDPGRDLFIALFTGTGNKNYRRYDPATRTFSLVGYSPKPEKVDPKTGLPIDLDLKFKTTLVPPDRTSSEFEWYVGGKLYMTSKEELRRNK